MKIVHQHPCAGETGARRQAALQAVYRACLAALRRRRQGE